jgi:hypothetical protein
VAKEKQAQRVSLSRENRGLENTLSFGHFENDENVTGSLMLLPRSVLTKLFFPRQGGHLADSAG